MGEYNYIVGGLFGFFIFVLVLGPMGGADDIYGDDFVVINSQDYTETELENLEYDFDYDRLFFTPEFNEPTDFQSASLGTDLIINDSDNLEFRDNGEIIAPSNEDAYISWNVTSRDDEIAIPFSYNSFRGANINFLVSGDSPPNSTLEGINSICYNQVTPYSSPVIFNLGNSSVPNEACDDSVYANIETLTITFEPYLTQTEGSIIDISGGDFILEESDSLLEAQLGDGAIGSFFDFMNALTSIVTEAITMFRAYLAFTIEVPGLLGTVLRGYALILFSVFAVKEIWL